MKNKKLIIFLSVLTIFFIGSLIFYYQKTKQTEAAVSRSGLILDLNFGNNNGSATPTVYDSSGFNRHATSTAGATSPTCTSKFCDFDGGDTITANATNVFNSSNISIAIKFSPDFAADSGASRGLMDTLISGDRYMIYKELTGESSYLWVMLGNANLAQIPVATYRPYWKVGQENVIIVSGTSGNNNVWLNGIKILSGDTTAWTAKNPTRMTMGSLNAGNNAFDGKIHYLKVWNRLLTDAEVGALSADRETFTNSAPIVASSTPNRRLVGHWTMDANDINGTTVYDKSGQGNNGTGVGIASADLVAGKINQGFDFDGSSEYISVANPALLRFTETTPFTIGLWFKTSVSGISNRMISKRSDDNDRYLMHIMADNKLEIQLSDGTNTLLVTGLNTISDGKWHFGTYDYDGANNLTLYVDGILQGTDSSPTLSGVDTASSGPGTLSIGAEFVSSNYFTGAIDDVRIYNYALSAQEVANLYSSAKVNYTASAPLLGLVGHWTMDANDINGTTVYDKSGKGNNGVGIYETSADLRAGKINQAIDFNGGSEYINLFANSPSTSTLSPTDAVTVSAWFKPGAISGYRAIAGVWWDGNFVGYGLWWNDTTWSNKISFSIQSYSINSARSQQAILPNDGKWHHAVGTYDKNAASNQVRIWVDGIEGTPATNTDPIPYYTNSVGEIGVTGGPTKYYYWAGSIDDVRIYNRALSAQEVSNLYQSAARNYVQ